MTHQHPERLTTSSSLTSTKPVHASFSVAAQGHSDFMDLTIDLNAVDKGWSGRSGREIINESSQWIYADPEATE